MVLALEGVGRVGHGPSFGRSGGRLDVKIEHDPCISFGKSGHGPSFGRKEED